MLMPPTAAARDKSESEPGKEGRKGERKDGRTDGRKEGTQAAAERQQ